MAFGDKLAQILFRGKDETGAAFASVQGHFSDLNRVLRELAPSIATALSVGGVISWAKSAINAADAMNDLSQRTGISVESLSKWKLVAEQNGASLESITPGLKSLAQNMEAAARGGKEQADAFTRLGVPVRDAGGQLRQMDEVMLDLAEKFSKMPDGAQKTALAVRVFGKAGQELIPVLNQGRDGIAELMATAERMGLVMSKEAAAAADEFNDSLGLIRSNVSSLAIEFVNQAAPAISQVARAMAEAARDGGLFASIIRGYGEAWKILMFGADPGEIDKQTKFIDERHAELAALLQRYDRLQQAIATERNPTILAIAERQAQEVKLKITEVRTTLDAAVAALRLMQEKAKQIQAPGVGVTPTGQLPETEEERLKKIAKASQEKQKLMQAELDYRARMDEAINGAIEVGDKETQKKIQNRIRQMQVDAEFIARSDEDINAVIALAEKEAKVKDEKNKASIAALFDSLRTEEEMLEEDFAQKSLLLKSHREEMEATYRAMYGQRAQDAELLNQKLNENDARYYEAAKRLDREYSDQKLRIKGTETARLQLLVNQARRGEITALRGLMAEAIPLMQSKSQTLFRIGKAVALAEAIVSTHQAIANALAVRPFPVGLALAAVAAAKGAIQIQAIRSAEIGGGAQPVFDANPATGLPTSQFPGFEPPPSPLQQPVQRQSVNITLISESGQVSVGWIRDVLIPGINDALGDGVVLNVR